MASGTVVPQWGEVSTAARRPRDAARIGTLLKGTGLLEPHDALHPLLAPGHFRKVRPQGDGIRLPLLHVVDVVELDAVVHELLANVVILRLYPSEMFKLVDRRSLVQKNLLFRRQILVPSLVDEDQEYLGTVIQIFRNMAGVGIETVVQQVLVGHSKASITPCWMAVNVSDHAIA